jgi:hypothetical protein
MNTMIKLECEEKEKAIEKLEELAYNMSEVCILSRSIMDKIPSAYQSGTMSAQGMTDWAVGYFAQIENVDVSEERCSKIVSKSKEKLADYDFMFEWFEEPTGAQKRDLEEEIKATIESTGCKATIEHMK